MSIFSTVLIAISVTALVYLLVWLLISVTVRNLDNKFKSWLQVKKLLKFFGIIYFIPIILLLVTMIHLPIVSAFIVLGIFISLYPLYKLFNKIYVI